MKKEIGILVLGSFKHPGSTIYNVERHNDGVSISYSNLDKRWINPGKVTSSITSDGNGLVFRRGNGDIVRLSYSDAVELRALLKLEDTQGCTFKYIKVEEK